MENESDRYNLKYRRQWYLGKERPKVDINWLEYVISADFKLFYHPDLAVSFKKLGDQSGFLLLGIALNPLHSKENFLNRLSKKRSYDQYIDEIINACGSYVLISYSENSIKLYNDAAGFMGVYFKKHSAASTPSLFHDLVEDTEILHDYKFGFGNDWYTGSVTPYLGVKKLLPNHCLDLNSCSLTRFWPVPDSINRGKNTPKSLVISKMIDLIQSQLSGILNYGHVITSLTGGQDSRVLLAGSKKNWDKTMFFTISGKNISKDDIDITKELIDLTNIKHTFVPNVSPPVWVLQLYDNISAGESIGARRDIAGTCLKLSGKNVIHVNGNLGAILKSYYWPSKRPEKFEMSSVLKDFANPGNIITDGIKEWHESTPDLPAHQIYNLFYLEQRGGRWMSAGENSSRLFYESFSPFNSRILFELVCQLPIELQYNGKLLKHLTEEMAPELINVRYQHPKRNWTKHIPRSIKKPLYKLIHAKQTH